MTRERPAYLDLIEPEPSEAEPEPAPDQPLRPRSPPRFDNRGERGQYAVIDFWDPWIAPLDNAVFLVETKALKSWCR